MEAALCPQYPVPPPRCPHPHVPKEDVHFRGADTDGSGACLLFRKQDLFSTEQSVDMAVALQSPWFTLAPTCPAVGVELLVLSRGLKLTVCEFEALRVHSGLSEKGL